MSRPDPVRPDDGDPPVEWPDAVIKMAAKAGMRRRDVDKLVARARSSVSKHLSGDLHGAQRARFSDWRLVYKLRARDGAIVPVWIGHRDDDTYAEVKKRWLGGDA